MHKTNIETALVARTFPQFLFFIFTDQARLQYQTDGLDDCPLFFFKRQELDKKFS